MALQPYEVCSVALLLRESDEVFLNSHVDLCILQAWILFLFKLTVIPCSSHIASWERRPPEQRGRYEVWETTCWRWRYWIDIQLSCGWSSLLDGWELGGKMISVSARACWGRIRVAAPHNIVRYLFKNSLCRPARRWSFGGSLDTKIPCIANLFGDITSILGGLCTFLTFQPS